MTKPKTISKPRPKTVSKPKPKPVPKPKLMPKPRPKQVYNWVVAETTEDDLRKVMVAPENWIKNGFLYWPMKGEVVKRKNQIPPGDDGWQIYEFKMLDGPFRTLKKALAKEKFFEKFSNSESERDEMRRRALKRKYPVTASLIDANHLFDEIKIMNAGNVTLSGESNQENQSGETQESHSISFEPVLPPELSDGHYTNQQGDSFSSSVITEIVGSMGSNERYHEPNYYTDISGCNNIIGNDNDTPNGTMVLSSYPVTCMYQSIISSSTISSSFPVIYTYEPMVSSSISSTYAYQSSNGTKKRQNPSSTIVSNLLPFQSNAMYNNQLLSTGNGDGNRQGSSTTHNDYYVPKYYPTPTYHATLNANDKSVSNGIDQREGNTPLPAQPNHEAISTSNTVNRKGNARDFNTNSNVVNMGQPKGQPKEHQQTCTFKKSYCKGKKTKHKESQSKQQQKKTTKINTLNLVAKSKVLQKSKKPTLKRRQLVKSKKLTREIGPPPPTVSLPHSSSALAGFINSFVPSPTHDMEANATHNAMLNPTHNNTQIDFSSFFKEFSEFKNMYKADRIENAKRLYNIEQRQEEILQKMATSTAKEERVFAQEDIEEFDASFPVTEKSQLDQLEVKAHTEPVYNRKLIWRMGSFGGKRGNLQVRSCMKYLVKDSLLDHYTWQGTLEKSPFEKLVSINSALLQSVQRNFPKYTKYKFERYMVQFLKHSSTRQRQLNAPARGRQSNSTSQQSRSQSRMLNDGNESEEVEDEGEDEEDKDEDEDEVDEDDVDEDEVDEDEEDEEEEDQEEEDESKGTDIEDFE